MADLLVLSDEEVRRLLPLGELAEAVRQALVSLSEGGASAPPRVGARLPDGLLAAMPGHVPAAGAAAKLVTVYPRNADHGFPTHQALIAVFDPSTGAPLAVMGGTYITAMRTAVTSVVAALALARRGPRRVAILGSGVQAAAHLTAVTALVGSVEEVRIGARDPLKASVVAAQHRRAVVAPSVAGAVDGADIVLCCTDAAEPVLAAATIDPGTHVGSVGSGAELPPGLLEGASVFVESLAATAPPPAGAAELQGRDPMTLTELGAVLGGRHPGRADVDDITVFKSTGHAVEDVAAASVVLRHAEARGAGTHVPFTEASGR